MCYTFLMEQTLKIPLEPIPEQSERRQTPRRPDHPSEQGHRKAVDVARELVKNDKTSTWEGILKRNPGRIRPWAGTPDRPPSAISRASGRGQRLDDPSAVNILAGLSLSYTVLSSTRPGWRGVG